MALYDCFVFHNEFDILEIRLREMADLVDHFVLVEANQTQRGTDKPYHFAENRGRFKAWADKIIDVQITFPDQLPKAHGKYHRRGGWERENYQRNCISQGLETAAPGDLVMVSDVDEIVRRSALQNVLETHAYRGKLVVFEQSLHKLKLDRVVPDKSWLLGSRMVEKKHLTTPQKLRRTRAKLRQRAYVPAGLTALILRAQNLISTGIGLPVEIVADGGWHFSSMGGLERFQKKLESVVHGRSVDYNDIEALYRREMAAYAPFPISDLPDCIAEGLFPDLLEDGRAK
ncbi:MAG: hypothetical protein JJ902_19960 [Roseibium sp.]|nr:hypothetical protein [Roseibium sp.]